MFRRLRALALLLPALAALPVVALRAESDAYPAAAKAFKEGIHPKNALADRRKAVRDFSAVADRRVTVDLIDSVKNQDKHAAKLRKEWAAEEKAWHEKTEKLERRVEVKRKRAKERGEDSVTLDSEEADWLGTTQREGKMIGEKKRIERLYANVLKEDEFIGYIFRTVARVMNALEGDEQQRALRDAVAQAKKAPAAFETYFMQMFAYVKGDVATDALISYTQSTKVETVILGLQALGRQNSERGRDVLIQRLEDPRWQIRSAAIDGLAFYKDPVAVEALIARAKKEEGILQRHFFAGLSRIVEERVPGTVEAWDSWWQSNKADMLKRWDRLPKGEPVEGDPPYMPVDTDLGSTSFYGIRTPSKHIIFVVDISGSMGEQGGKNEAGLMRIDVARNELKSAIQSLSAVDEDERGAASFNIVTFESFVEVYQAGKMVTATKRAKDSVAKWIDEKIQPTGWTNIYDAVEQAFQIMGSKEAKNLDKGADTIFLMTDGYPNRGKFHDSDLILQAVAELNRVRKITIHTIGVGDNHDKGFLERMAAMNNGQYLAR